MTQIFDWDSDTETVEADLSRPGLLALIDTFYAVGASALHLEQYTLETDKFIQTLKEWLKGNNIDIQQPFARAVLGLLREATTQGMDVNKRGKVKLITTQLFNILARGEPTKQTGEALTEIGRQIKDLSNNDRQTITIVNRCLEDIPK